MAWLNSLSDRLSSDNYLAAQHFVQTLLHLAHPGAAWVSGCLHVPRPAIVDLASGNVADPPRSCVVGELHALNASRSERRAALFLHSLIRTCAAHAVAPVWEVFFDGVKQSVHQPIVDILFVIRARETGPPGDEDVSAHGLAYVG